MSKPESRQSGAEKQTLVQRMAQARDRTVAARQGAGLTPGQMADPTFAGKAATLAVSGPRWRVRARAGEALMLMPGEMHFGGEAGSVRTLLGSCVAVTLWHPQRRIGGMCHFLLPARARRGHEALEGKYGDEALQAMVECLRASNTEPREYEAHLYGGADTMPEGAGVKFNVGERNIEQGWSLIDRYGFQLQGVDVGEDVPRTVTLTLASGEVEMRRGNARLPANTLPTKASGPAGSRRS